jgi:hypothetical protein
MSSRLASAGLEGEGFHCGPDPERVTGMYVLAWLAGVERAKEIRRYIQYDPLPPV